MVGGMVVFLETENTEKLIYFYEVQNQFKKFDVREVRKEDNHKLVQLLKIL